jgi:hypothetical protein
MGIAWNSKVEKVRLNGSTYNEPEFVLFFGTAASDSGASTSQNARQMNRFLQIGWRRAIDIHPCHPL